MLKRAWDSKEKKPPQKEEPKAFSIFDKLSRARQSDGNTVGRWDADEKTRISRSERPFENKWAGLWSRGELL